MGRPKKNENDKKIKIGITIDRELYYQIKKDKNRNHQRVKSHNKSTYSKIDHFSS